MYLVDYRQHQSQGLPTHLARSEGGGEICRLGDEALRLNAGERAAASLLRRRHSGRRRGVLRRLRARDSRLLTGHLVRDPDRATSFLSKNLRELLDVFVHVASSTQRKPENNQQGHK